MSSLAPAKDAHPPTPPGSDPRAPLGARPWAAGACGCVLLCGGATGSALERQAGSTVANMPSRSSRTMAEEWLHWLADATGAAGDGAPRLIACAHAAAAEAPAITSPPDAAEVMVVQDSTNYRGTAGAIRDAWELIGCPDVIVVAESSRLLHSDPFDLVSSHRDRGGEVTVYLGDHGEPTGVAVLSRSAVEQIPSMGYIDFKEQWLNKLQEAGRYPSWVEGELVTSTPIIRLDQYLRELRRWGRMVPVGSGHARVLVGSPEDPLWVRSAVSLIDERAEVSPGACVVDSVVMQGASVADGAVVVRSLIGRGARVQPNARLVDTVVRTRGLTDRPGPLVAARAE